jgi:hypothetical protein
VVCKDPELTMSYESFSSANLLFEYEFKNFLNYETPNLREFVLTNVSRKTDLWEISLEREVFCSEDGQAPSQTALYDQQEEGLVLTTVTNTDETLYNRSCVISNTFKLPPLDLKNKETFNLLYQNEKGQLFDLNACFVDGKLYAPEDVFKDSSGKQLCTCEGPEITCESL